ncbi:MAG: succinate dehydrogenase, cytochrome b556 subunit [Candidatus Marinimicrobia bacterium]|nr:succinate dehydrogenase, cytochrome b556 subunit [Candidatus Neomarinimicrobiota bacterium]
MRRVNTFSHYRMNLRLGMFSFLSHRITGIILLFAGFLILLGLSVIMLGKNTFEDMLLMLRSPLYRVLAHIVIIALYWHVLNGIKILIIDLFRAGRIHKVLTLIIIVIFILGVIFYFIYAFPGLVHP